MILRSRSGARSSFGLSARAHVVVIVVVLVGAWFLLRLLRRRQMRGKYTLLWMFVGVAVLVLAAFPAILDRAARWLRIYYSPNLLFLLAIGVPACSCASTSRASCRGSRNGRRILAEELALLRGESVEAGQTPRARAIELLAS